MLGTRRGKAAIVGMLLLLLAVIIRLRRGDRCHTGPGEHAGRPPLTRIGYWPNPGCHTGASDGRTGRR